jgi:hypothetical protein
VTTDNRNSSNIQFALVALLFGGPLLLATLMYSAGIWRPASTTNHGAILEPKVNLAESMPQSQLHSLVSDQWVMIYSTDSECASECRDALLRLRQSRLMLGNDMNRVSRVLVHGDNPPDREFLQDFHAGLITLSDKALQRLLADKRPAELLSGGIFLIDPLGNLIMYFTPDIDPGDMVDDIKHLLELSRIG